MRWTLCRVRPIARPISDTLCGSPSAAPSTCHQAAVSPTGRASSSATARSWPLSRKLVSAASDEQRLRVGLIAHEAAISSWNPAGSWSP